MSLAQPVLFETADHPAVLTDPANADWAAVVHAVSGERFEVLERRYYAALYHFRQQATRGQLRGRIQLEAQGKAQALQGMLELMEQHKANRSSDNVFVDARPDSAEESLPEVLKDFSKTPAAKSDFLSGRGRPPCDALCLMRAFLAAPLLGVGDDPSSVHRLLHSNPTFARACEFLGRDAVRQPSELTSRRLPSLTVCEEFSEVMTRYGLWQLARLDQVRDNFARGIVPKEDTACFDTTHILANSHCANVVPAGAEQESGEKPKHRKVARVRKHCDCGEQQWESCEHPWTPTDQGAAVVVKGSSRIYWAHKASVMNLADSEIPIDVRVCEYAADPDGKTLVPHLERVKRDLPEVIDAVRIILADDAYKENRDALGPFGARLIVPVHGRKTKDELAKALDGINRFTPSGIPVCEAGHRFELWGRDVPNERFIWVAPNDGEGKPVCASCPVASRCVKRGKRRHLRVDRKDFPNIDWDHPQHFARERSRYERRTGIERAIKRLKVDLRGEQLTHRDSLRVQAHLDRKLLIVHLLLAAAASS